MAEAILKRLISTRVDANQWHVESAGTWAIEGCQAAELSQLVMQGMGMDISQHESQPVTDDLLRHFNLILTMENQHKEGLDLQFGQFRDRIFMLSEMVGTVEDIKDPMGKGLPYFEETARKLEQVLTDGFDRICELALTHQKVTGKLTAR